MHKKSYLKSLIHLLELKMEENHPSFFIANRRYRMLKLKDVEFLDSTPKFDEVFCKKETGKNND